MNRNWIILLFLVIVGGSIAAFVAYVKQYSPKYIWEETLTKESEEPYGLSLFYDALKSQPQKTTLINKRFYENLDTSATNTNLLVFGTRLYIDSLKAAHLLKYVANGNNALIACNEAPIQILRQFFHEEDTVYEYEEYYDSLVTVSFEGKEVPFPNKIDFHHQYLKDTAYTYWSGYLYSSGFDLLQKNGFEHLSFLGDSVVNCYYIKHGEGTIYFHSNPILFSNYHIIQKNGFEHTNNLLSVLNEGEIFWDETSLYPSYDYDRGASAKNNPLQFLFSHYTLRWGWYLFLATVVLFLLFRSKREQRIIPLLPKNTNTTIEHTKAIGVLYLQKGEHKNIAQEMYLIFLASIRNNYHLATNVDEKDLVNELSARSKIKIEDLNSLFKQFRSLRFSPMANSKDLIKLHQTIEEYHKKRQ